MESGSGPESPAPGARPPTGAPPASHPGAIPSRQTPAAPGYGGPVPPGGWQQAPPGPPSPPALGQSQLGGWGARLGATIIDGLLIGIPSSVVLGALGLGLAGAAGSGSEVGLIALIGAAIVTFAVLSVVSLIYAPLLMMRSGEHNGQTLGKQWLGLRVIRTDGQPMGFGWAALREVLVKNFGVGVASAFTLGLAALANYLWPLFDDQNRALHDYVASTRVVRV